MQCSPKFISFANVYKCPAGPSNTFRSTSDFCSRHPWETVPLFSLEESWAFNLPNTSIILHLHLSLMFPLPKHQSIEFPSWSRCAACSTFIIRLEWTSQRNHYIDDRGVAFIIMLIISIRGTNFHHQTRKAEWHWERHLLWLEATDNSPIYCNEKPLLVY